MRTANAKVVGLRGAAQIAIACSCSNKNKTNLAVRFELRRCRISPGDHESRGRRIARGRANCDRRAVSDLDALAVRATSAGAPLLSVCVMQADRY